MRPLSNEKGREKLLYEVVSACPVSRSPLIAYLHHLLRTVRSPSLTMVLISALLLPLAASVVTARVASSSSHTSSTKATAVYTASTKTSNLHSTSTFHAASTKKSSTSTKKSSLMLKSSTSSKRSSTSTSVKASSASKSSIKSSTADSTATTTKSSASPTVTLDYCSVAAAAGNSSLGYYKYQNIRYAAVPTGSLRWAEPEWPPIETAVNHGTLADSDVDCSSAEDCLYLDIWAPANSAGKSLPVMVWTYGGGFTGGSKSQNTPEGLFDLSKDFVYVAYNYRLGLTGLANGPTFLHEGGTSNTAIWDVQHAFQWVQKYISKFGGNPNEVTAVGFSAGGSQTLFQLTVSFV